MELLIPGDVEVDLAVRARAAQRLLPARCLVGDRCPLWLLAVDVLPPGPPRLDVVVPAGRSSRRVRTCMPGIRLAGA